MGDRIHRAHAAAVGAAGAAASAASSLRPALHGADVYPGVEDSLREAIVQAALALAALEGEPDTDGGT